jgi:glycosyltransferase involved in cell wall biosynthesis
MEGKGGKALYDLIQQYDLFIFPRMQVRDGDKGVEFTNEFFNVIRELGKKVVYEVDDDYTNRHRVVTSNESIKVAALADAITVTTPYLKRLMESETGKPAYVLPNCVSPEQWFQGKANVRKPEFRDKLVIGLTGSPTHENDWKVLETVMPDILARFPNVVLMNVGYTPEYLTGLPQARYVPPLKYDLYCQIIRGCDIILAPVDPTDGFNLGKSPIKAVEGMAATRMVDNRPAGAAVIATNNPIYQIAIRNNKNGLLVDHTPQAWSEALRELIENTQKRKSFQFAGNKYAKHAYDISKEWVRWDRAYRQILDS